MQKIAMYRLPRIAAIALAAILCSALLIVLLLLCAAGVVALTARPNDYKGAITARVQEKTGRTLTIPGDIALRFYPRPAITVGKALLSEHGGSGTFATIDGLRLSLALVPLLRGDFVVDRLEVRGARARLLRLADGSMNIDDLTAARIKTSDRSKNSDKIQAAAGPGPAPQKIGFSVHSIRIDNAHLTFDDRKHGRMVEIARLNMDSGPIEHGVPSRVALSANVGVSRPAVNTAITLASGFMLDRDTRRLALTGLDINLDIKLGHADDGAGTGAGAHAMARLNGSVDIDLAKDKIDVVLKGRLDDSAIDAKGAAHAGVMQLALDIDKLDLDRYRAARPAPASATGAAVGPGAAALPAGSHTAFPSASPAYPANPAPSPSPAATSTGTAAAPQGAEPVDLSALATLRANGKLRIGALKAGGIRMENVNAVLRADAGKVALDPVLATLYGGSGKGSLVLDYAADPDTPATPRIGLAQTLSGIELGPLLRDAAGKAGLSGRGEVAINIHTQGASVPQLRQALGGYGSLRLADGSVSGLNLARAIRELKSGAGVAGESDRTDFTELNASFKIVDGILHSDDLLAKTALLRIAGSGAVDLVQSQIDYTVWCTAVPTLQGQGGPDADALKGFTVPVRLSGPLSGIAWSVDMKAMAADPAVRGLKDKLKDKLDDKLRGLLRR